MDRKIASKNRDEKFQREFQQLGFYAPETLEIFQEINPLEVAKKSSITRLNYLLGFVKRKKLESFESFVKNLQKTYASLTKADYCKIQKYSVNDLIKDFEYLKEYKQLAINSLNYFLGLLELSSDVDWVNEKVKVPKGDFFRSFLIPRYQNVSILSETIGREEGIMLYKIYRTEHAKISTPEDRKYRFETLEDLRNDDFQDYKDGGNPGWVRIEGIVKNGKFVYRKDSCLYAEAMKDYPDKEFKFLAACYYDYQGTRIQWNKDFILTMDQTIASGDSYCSCVVHDTRIDWDLTHPSKEYWDSIWPLQDWQKKTD
ncbi:MAG: L-2-amino-thiazoline-4-carboxylic acid hydrolase [Candidatus Heimdallarchaeota archaeon]